MTSEICVMNRRSLVLAADSAATVSRWERGKQEERYFKGSNKIFQLSNIEPIGVMIYDSADLHRIPWEIIVKTFRDWLADQWFETVEEYGQEFFAFIQNHRGLFPAEHLDEALVESIDQLIIRSLRDVADNPTVKAAGKDVGAITQAKNEALQKLLDDILNEPIRPPFDDASVQVIRNRLDAKLVAEAETDVTLFSPDAGVDTSLLVELAFQTAFRTTNHAQSETGIVIAGYGKNDFFPSFVEFSCTGFLAEHLCFTKAGDHAISRHDSGFFKTFATTSMTDTFTMGFGPDVFRSVRKHLATALRDFAAKLAKDTGKQSAKTERFIDETMKLHTSGWTEDTFEQHARPLRRVIGSLPIDELASLAETLVMLESLKEKVTSPSESVGGPIDVAIITKHEGFVWAKRKLYFDPKLNPRYFLRQQLPRNAEMEGDDVGT